jgi:pimeloyl-[acyl-carrier protein] synthase
MVLMMSKSSLQQFLGFNPRHPELHANPYPIYDHMRTQHPICFRPKPGDWLLTRYADVVSVLQNDQYGHAQWRATVLQQQEDAQVTHFLRLRQDSQYLIKLWVVQRNPPEHTRLRQLLQQCLTPQMVMGLRSRIQAIVDELLDRVQAQGDMDIIADLAQPLPLQVICQIMGIPSEEAKHPLLKRWCHDLGLMVDLDALPIAYERSLLAMIGLSQYFRELLAKWHTLPHPSDNLISTLLQAQSNGQLNEAELVGNCIFLFVGGHLTTQNLIGNGVLALLRHPEQWHMLQEQPTLVPRAIHEILRYEPPIQIVSRTALSAMSLSGVTIHPGQIVHCILGAANRDPAQFSDPNSFDITRQQISSLAFGAGAHYCLGARLAQLEGQVAISTLVRRYPHMSLQTKKLQWEDSSVVHGLKSLPVRL